MEEGQIIEKEGEKVIGSDNGKSLSYLRKRKEYARFKQLIRQGRYTTGVLASKACGVSRETITTWLNTKEVHDLFIQTADLYVSRIEVSKDWKAQAYLLDKITGIEASNNPNNQQMIGLVVNVNPQLPTK
jgi:hypothetical protein